MILNTTSNSSGYDHSVCDESRCVSTGLSEIYNGSFTCYGDDDGNFYPKLCADGFLPVVVDKEPSKLAADVSGHSNVTLRYFTCCPPIHAAENSTPLHSVVRHCSDPILARGNTTDITAEEACNDHGESKKYPRRMKSNIEESYGITGMVQDRTEIDAFLCCDNLFDTIGNSSEAIMAKESYLEISECVPYRNEFYEPSRVENQVGQLQVISCDFADGNFSVPRPIDNNEAANGALSGRYQCCQSGTDLPPYVYDSALRITIYPLLILDCIAAFASFMVIVGLLIPLAIQLRFGSIHKAKRWRSERRTWRWKSSLTFQSTSSRNAPVSSDNPRPSDPNQQDYSTYNLYLVYLAIPDFIWAVIRIGLEANIINQIHNPSFYTMLVLPPTFSWVGYAVDGPGSATVFLANFYLNAIIAYQLWLLLKSFRRAQRIPQPSLRRVSLQAIAVYLGALIYLGFDLYLREAARTAEAAEDFDRAFYLMGLLLTVFYVLAIAPIGYVVGMSVWVWCRGYIPSAGGNVAASKGIRELFFYFFRIVFIFIVIFIPSLLLNLFGGLSGQTWAFCLTMATGSLQAIATTCLILTKSDVRKYLRDLVTLSYVFGDTTDGDSANRPSDLPNSAEKDTTEVGGASISHRSDLPSSTNNDTT